MLSENKKIVCFGFKKDYRLYILGKQYEIYFLLFCPVKIVLQWDKKWFVSTAQFIAVNTHAQPL